MKLVDWSSKLVDYSPKLMDCRLKSHRSQSKLLTLASKSKQVSSSKDGTCLFICKIGIENVLNDAVNSLILIFLLHLAQNFFF